MVNILFSGGIDSSLTACKMAEQNKRIKLVNFFNGALISNDLPLIRYHEIKNVYGNDNVEFIKYNSYGLFRKIALSSLEDDMRKYGINLVCLGCKLSMHAQNIILCKQSGVKQVADGVTKKQEKYGEQRSVAIDFFHTLYKEYDIAYLNPIYNLTKKEIKYELLDRGITIQSLEDTCLFSNTFSTPNNEVIEQYLNDKKNIIKNTIERRLLK